MLSKGMKQNNKANPKPTFLKHSNKKIMKTQNNTFFQNLGKAQLDNLVNEVKETVATGIPNIQQKTAFGVVDLWNLERSRKTRMVRRHLA